MTVENKTTDLIDEMYTEAARLKSFKNWPFDENSSCSAARMAEAGFFHCPTDTEKDLVQCYVCFKELDGWESTDVPWAEHLSHSKFCTFAKLGKPQNNLTISDLFTIEAERKINKLKRITAAKIQHVKGGFEDIEEFADELYEEICKGK